ncbi:MAG: TSCPD domain-containing protein, partial [Planctomycetota bacterium]
DANRCLFDIDGFEHAIRLWTIVLEISVLMAAFPSEEIARQSYRFRTLGLGFANLGAMLMQAGIPYDSEDGRALCGAITSILCGRAYATSAEMARSLSPFAAYRENRESMLRVIRNHRRAAHGLSREADAYEELSIKPVPIDHGRFKDDRMTVANAAQVLKRATAAWDEALAVGEEHGYRNAQVTVIAPTGTIGLLMDCDTTGVEPDFALVKFKKLAGGGYFKIANASLRPALKTLGYGPDQIDEVFTHVMGTLSLDTEMPTTDDERRGRSFREFLLDAGYTSEELVELENLLPTVFELPFAFTAWTMPARLLESLGVDVEAARADGRFDGLRQLGLTPRQVEQLNERISGTQTVEGAPHLLEAHLPVFDCANKCGRNGRRFIATTGHIRMMAAAQPFISGAISKTINLPHEATEQDIADAYWLSWELGLKANALYRDGSKLSQPLSTRADETETDEEADPGAMEAALGEASTEAADRESATSTSSPSSGSPARVDGDLVEADDEAADERLYVERIVEKIVERPLRRRLSDTRDSITHRFNVAGHEGYLTVGLYEDGRPGELFITMSKEGSTIGGLMDSLGTAISVALQYGVPVESLVKKFEHQRFEPMGITGNRDIPFAKSLVDYIFRWMGMAFIPGYREANAPQRLPAKGAASSSGGQDAPAARTASEKVPIKEDRTCASDTSHDGTATSARTGGSHAGGSGGVTARTAAESPSVRTTVRADHLEVDLDVDGSEMMIAAARTTTTVASALDQSNAGLQGDAPACDNCGAITVRNGTCYKCLNCGSSMGCS